MLREIEFPPEPDEPRSICRIFSSEPLSFRPDVAPNFVIDDTGAAVFDDTGAQVVAS